MTKLPPNAKRVIVNGNPYIAHEDDKGRIIRLEDDYDARLARLPVNQRIAARKTAETKQRFVSRGKAVSDV